MKLKNLLIVLLIIGVFGSTVQAATNFNDVKETAWYYQDISKLVDLNILSGYPDGTFKPMATISNAEALKIILNAAGIAPKKVISSSDWSEGYIQAAIEKDIINEKTFQKDAFTTREQMAEMIVKALGGDFQTTVIKGYFKDTTNRSVETLYDMGLVSGVTADDGLYYKPMDAITRAEISVLAIRLFNYFENKTIDTKPIDPNIAPFEMTASLKESEILLVKEPKTVNDFQKVLVYMVSHGVLEYEIPYNMLYTELTNLEVINTIETAAELVFSQYPEYFSFINNVEMHQKGSTIGKNSTILINLESKYFTQGQIKEKIKIFHQKTEEVVIGLIEDKKLLASMTDREKAKVLYEWMAINNSYDLSFAPESYTGYGAAVNKTAVCHGYVAMYNLMCKLVGIEVEGIIGRAGEPAEDHMWTLAILDGKRLHIDPTFGDPVPDKAGYCNFDYFARESAFMRNTHTWDTALFGK